MSTLLQSFRPARSYGCHGIPDEVVSAMWADYQRTGSLRRTGQKFGRSPGAMNDIFARRGLRQSPPANQTLAKGARGRFVAKREFSEAEILAEVAKLRRAMIPPPLIHKWRRWTRERRAWLVKILWQHMDEQRPGVAMPRGPYSANVEPFDYTSERAHAIAAESNRGLNSQKSTVKIKLGTRGVIYQGKLYSWTGDDYRNGKFEKNGRPSLQELIWREAGRTIPPHHVLRFKDGNRNNFALSNLELCPREKLLRENQAAALARRSRAAVNALLAGASRFALQLSPRSSASGNGSERPKARPTAPVRPRWNRAASATGPRRKTTHV